VKITVSAAALALSLLPAMAPAQVFRWEEPGGTMHFTNAADRVPELYRSQVGPLPPPQVTPDVAPAPPSAEQAPVATARVLTRIPFAPGTPIVVSARISDAGTAITLILDTGADRTIVAPQALWRLGISTADAPRAVIRGVTGASEGGVVDVSSIQVGDAKVGPLRIVAHDADLKQAEGLLGRDFLEHFTVTIDAREQIVTLAPK
jgi:aspartyl protease/uncharacterized protein DUF4124